MKPIPVGVIGVGHMGRNHVRVYSSLRGADLRAIADIDRASAKKIGKMYGVDWYVDYREMIKNEDLEAVSVVVPTSLHTEICIYATKCGINVLVEKPIASSLRDAKMIVKEAERGGVKLMVGQTERFNPAVQALKRAVHRGNFGKIILLSAKRVGPIPPRIKDVGVTVDLAIHDIDVMRYITESEVSSVFAFGNSVVAKQEDQVAVLLEFINGTIGMIETNWLTPVKIRRLTLTGSKGYAQLDYIDQQVSIYEGPQSPVGSYYKGSLKRIKNPERRSLPIKREEPLKKELQHFLGCILNDHTPLVDGDEGIKSLKVTLATLKSARKKARIEL